MVDYRCLLSSCSRLDKLGLVDSILLILKSALRLLCWHATNPFKTADTSREILLISSYGRKDLMKDVDTWLDNTRRAIDHKHLEAKNHFGLYLPDTADFQSAKEMVDDALPFLEFALSKSAKVFLYLRALEALKYEKSILLNFNWPAEKPLVSHMEMQLLENVALQCAKKKGVPTYTMQHGFYSFDGTKLSAQQVNPVNYLASVSEVFLSWGDRTLTEVSPYLQAKTKTVGKPHVLVEDFKESDQPNTKILVLLDSSAHQDLNRALLERLKVSEFDQNQVFLIQHPDDHNNYGFPFAHSTHNEFFPSIVIGMHSSALIQYGITGHKLIVYGGSRLLRGAQDHFGQFFDLMPIKGHTFINQIPIDYWKSFIQYHSKEAIEKLDSVFDLTRAC